MNTKSLFKKSIKPLTLSSFLLWNIAFAAPEGGTVVQGSAEISQSPNQTVINQSSQNAVINWNSFNTASHEAVQFNQPNASSVALNRITNGLPTQFAGELKANGQVWILNPAGVLFTNTARVDVAGLVATTHGILDANFMAGNYQFDLVPGFDNAKIINNGLISVKEGGIVALVAPYVENNGVIVANLGKVNLSTGASYVLDLYGDNLINFGSNAPIENGSVSNAGHIIANGGKVYMTAHSAAKVVENVVSMSGVIEANAVSVNQKGEIVLHGGSEGTTVVSGKLHAKGGGHIETSGAHLIIEPSTEIDAGVGGSWLIDPWNITVVAGSGLVNNGGAPTFTPSGTSQIGATLISNQLSAGTNVILDTGIPGTDLGNITISSAITWSTAAELTLIAANNLAINAAVNGGANGLVTLNAGGAITQTGSITANSLSVLSGAGTNLGSSGNSVSIFSATNTTSGNIVFGNNSANLFVNSISQQANGTLSITNTGNIIFNNPYSVTGNTTFTSTAGNVIFNNTVNDAVALSHSLSIRGLVFPTFSSTPGGTTRLGTLNITYQNITVDPTLATFILDQLNNGTNMGITSSATGLIISTPLVTSSGTAALTFSNNITANQFINIAADVITGGAQTYNSSVLNGGVITLQSGVTIAGGSTISIITNNAINSAVNINGTIGTIAKRSPISFQLGRGTSPTDSGLTMGVGHSIVATNFTLIDGAGGDIVINTPWNLNMTGALSMHTDVSTAIGVVRITSTGQLGTSSLPIPSITLIGHAPGGLSSGVVVQPGAQIYANTLSILDTRGGSPQGLPNITLDNGAINAFHVTGVMTISTTANGGGTVTINGAIGAPGDLVGSLSVSATFGITLNSPTTIMTAGNQTYNNFTTLVSNQTLSSVSGVIRFVSTLNGAFDLITSSISGSTRFDNIVGGTDPLNNLTISGTTDIRTTAINTTGNQIFNNTVSLLAGSTRTLASTAGSISMLGAVNGATNLSLSVPVGQFITFGGPVGAATALTSFTTSATGKTHINGGSVRTSGAQNYLNPIVLGANTVLSSTGGGALNFVSINSDGTPRGLTLTTSAMTTFTGNIGAVVSPAGKLKFLTITNASTINIPGPPPTMNVTEAFTFGGPLTLLTDIAFNTDAGGTISFNSTINGENDLIANATPTGNVFFNGMVGGGTPLNSLEVTGQVTINTTAIDTSGDQLFNNAVLLDSSSVLISSVGNITFGGTIDSAVNGPWDLTVNANETRFKGNVGGSQNPTGALTVNSDIINFDGNVTSVTTSGTQTYNGATAMTIGVDPLFMAPNFVINIPAIILADTTYISTVGDIDFQSTIDGTANLLLIPSGLAIFQGDVGVSIALASLVVLGDTLVDGATFIRTMGDQIYSNIMTLNNNLSTLALTTGAIYFGDQNSPLSGVYGSGFDLSAVTNNAANGPTGAGITGIVRVNNFTVGGLGGANLSFNYPTAESFVLTHGAEQAILNTIISPDFRSSGAYYCVNNFCNLLPIPNPVSDIPPTQIFEKAVVDECGSTGCDNLEIIVGKNYCAYSEINLMENDYNYKKDEYKNKYYHKLLWKQEQDCLCQEDYRKVYKDEYMNDSQHKAKWANYCKQQKGLLYLSIKHREKVATHVDVATKNTGEKQFIKISKFSDSISWNHFPVTKHDMYMR